MPTLIIQGDDDQIVPLDDSGRLFAQIVKDATLKVYPAPRTAWPTPPPTGTPSTTTCSPSYAASRRAALTGQGGQRRAGGSQFIRFTQRSSDDEGSTHRPLPQRRAAGTKAAVHLHGHQLERTMARAATAEAVGTFVLVLAITSLTPQVRQV